MINFGKSGGSGSDGGGSGSRIGWKIGASTSLLTARQTGRSLPLVVLNIVSL